MITTMTEMREIDRDEMAGVDGGHLIGEPLPPPWYVQENGPVP